MAGTFRRALIVGAAVFGGLTACGQAVDHTADTPGGAGTSPSSAVERNMPPAGGLSYGTNADTTSMAGDQPLTPLQRRTAGDIQVRLFTSSFTGGEQCSPNSTQCVPPWCQQTGILVAEVSNDAMTADQVGAVIGLAASSQVSLLNSFVVGTAEHSPVLLVMVRVAGDITQVRLTAAGGTDTAAPAEGLAVLALPGFSDSGTVTLLDSDGHPRGSLTLPQASTVETTACAPQPLALPKAGRQPADPVGADQAVRAAFAKAFTAVPNDNSYSSLTAVQGGGLLHTALDQLRHNFAQAAASSNVDTGQLVFTDPQTAVLKFTLHYTGGVPYGTHNGTAVFENGAWLVSRTTYCSVLSFGDATCPTS